MDAQKWNDVPILRKTLPGLAKGGSVGIRMDYSVHTDTIALSVEATSAHIDGLRGAVALVSSHGLQGINFSGLDISM